MNWKGLWKIKTQTY